MLFTFAALLFFQISTYHYETLDWDINAFLVTSLEFGRGNLPFEYQYENKPPLLFAIFYLFSIITNKSLVYINLLNDLIICLILGQTIFLFNTEKKEIKINNFLPGLIFILLISNVWFHPSYSEYLSLFFIVSALLIYKKLNSIYKYFLIGSLLALSSLINIGTSIFLVCFLIIYFIQEKKIIHKIFSTLLGFGFIHTISISVYFFNGALEEYVMAMLFIPLSYGGTEFSFSNSITVFLTSFISYSFYIYLLLLVSISIALFKVSIIIKNQNIKFKNIEILFFIIFSLLFYSLAGKGYYHHLIFFLYFVSLSSIWIRNILNNRYFTIFVFVTLFLSLNQYKDQTFENIQNFYSIEDNYPVRSAAGTIIKKKLDYENIFSSEHVLLLYYLDKQNSSYIVHPALYDYEEITSVLIEFDKISQNEIYVNSIKNQNIIEGSKIENINSDFYELDFEIVNHHLLNYWDTDSKLKIFISKK